MDKIKYSICITGGAGMLGSHLADLLLFHGHEVTVIDNLSMGYRKNVNEKAKFYYYDISSKNIDEIFELQKFDYVFHMAAQISLRTSINDPLFDAEQNIIGSLNIINNCIKYKIKKIIFISSGGAIYSEQENILSSLQAFNESSTVNPSSPYGLSKLTVEKYLNLMYKLHGLKYTILRPSNIYGIRQNEKGEAGVIAIFISNVLNTKDLYINGNGFQTRDFIYVSDVSNACLHVMNDDIKFIDVFNVSTGIDSDINYIAKSIIDLMWANTNIKYKPKVEGEMLYCRLNSDKLQATDWSPQISLDIGLAKTVKWFCEEYGK